jgi:hypothetical protein
LVVILISSTAGLLLSVFSPSGLRVSLLLPFARIFVMKLGLAAFVKATSRGISESRDHNW